MPEHAAGPKTGFPPIADLLRRLDVRPNKHRAQHFLRRQEVCARIADLSVPTPDTHVIEVGAGLGNLSVEVAARARQVVAVEKDATFREWHRDLELRWPNLLFVHGDFLEVDLGHFLAAAVAAGEPVAACGNLPYQITSPILFRLVDSGLPFRRITAMMQLEVAERICAGPGTRECGALTAKIALRYRSSIAMRIAPGEFLPPPAVQSAVVVLEPLAAPLHRDAAHLRRICALLDGVFRYRRKTLSNGLLEAGLCEGRPEAEAVLRGAGIDPMRRAETLSLEEIIALEASHARRRDR